MANGTSGWPILTTGARVEAKCRRKVWAPLRVREVRTSMQRVLRLTCETSLLAPQRQPKPARPKSHDRTIPGERLNPKRGIYAAGFTLAEGRMAICGTAHHAAPDPLGIAVAMPELSFEAIEQIGYWQNGQWALERLAFQLYPGQARYTGHFCWQAHSVSQWLFYVAFGAKRRVFPVPGACRRDRGRACQRYAPASSGWSRRLHWRRPVE